VILITSNLGIVARYADRVLVMYAGRVVEAAKAPALYGNPSHPYTLGLLRSVPRLDHARKEKLDVIAGMPPDLTRLPGGCAFWPRCPFAVERCKQEVPPLMAIADGHSSACWEWGRVVQSGKAVAPTP